MIRKMAALRATTLFAAVVLVPSVVVDAWAESLSVVPTPVENPALVRALAAGDFYCVVDVVDPPVGTGVPGGAAGIEFRDFLGVVATGGVNRWVDLGSGDRLDSICQALAEQMASHARSLDCTSGPIRTVEVSGSNFVEKRRSFDFVCIRPVGGVLEAIGALLSDVMTAPAAPQVSRRASAERRTSATLEEDWKPSPQLRQMAPTSTPVP